MNIIFNIRIYVPSLETMVYNMKRGHVLLITSILLMNVLFILPSSVYTPVKGQDYEMDHNIVNSNSSFLGTKEESSLNMVNSTETRTTLDVPGAYSTISAAVAAASTSGDTIQVGAGTYNENVVIPPSKSIAIVGSGSGSTTISGSGTGSVIIVNGDSSTIRGFTITNSGVASRDAGILLNSDYNTIENCNVSRNNLGIYLNNSDWNTIANNSVDSNYGVDPVTSGLVGYWKMDEVSWTGAAGEVKDSSGNGNDGTAKGGVSTISGKYGRAGNLDGINDYINVPHDSEFSMTNGLTLSTWVKFNSKGAYDKILSKAYSAFPNPPYQEWAFGLDSSGSNFAFELTTEGSLHVVESRTVPSIGIWYHATGIFDGSQMSIFVNGGKENFITTTGSISNFGRDIQIGRYEAEPNEYNHGPIDEVRIYNRPLSKEEVLDNYISGVQGGITLQGSNKNTFINNTLDSNIGHGISLIASNDNTLMDNAIIDNGGSGVFIKDSNSNDVTGNTVESNDAVDTMSDVGLVGYWKMDESSWSGTLGEVKDASGLGNDGTAKDGATTSSGRFRNAGFFDGIDDSIEVPDDVSHHFGVNDFSIAAWVKTSNSGGDNTILAKEPGNDHYNMRVVSGKVRLFVQGNNNQNRWEYSNNPVADNNWHHVVGVYDAFESDIIIYIDGSEVSTTVGGTGNPDVVNPNSPLRIGKLYPTGGTSFFDGLIDEVRIYNRFLSEREIRNHYLDGIRGGIHLRGSNSNTISENIILDNVDYGVRINDNSDSNTVDHNFILENNPGFPQAHDDGIGNDWGIGSEGNYWSDWLLPDGDAPFGIVDVAYDLEGLSTRSDDHPLCLKTIEPVNQTPYEDNYYYEQCLVENAYMPNDWTVIDKPDWLTFASNGSIYGVTENDDVGPYWVNATISDEYCSSSINFTIIVNNIPPDIITENVLLAEQDEEYYVDYNSSDDGQGDVTWHFTSKASWLYFNSITGVLNGTPTDDNVGTFAVNISVDDGNDGWDYTQFALEVIGVNDPPSLVDFHLDRKNIFRGESTVLYIHGSDPENGTDILTPIVEARSPATAWIPLNCSYNSEGNNFTSTYLTNATMAVGEYSFRVKLKDYYNASSDWFFFHNSLIVRNSLPIFFDNFTAISAYNDRNTLIDMTGYGEDYENLESELDWEIIEYSPLSLFDAYKMNRTAIEIWPNGNQRTGIGTILFKLTDKDGGSTFKNISVEIMNASQRPRISILLQSPENGTIIGNTSMKLTWSAEGYEGIITYDLFFGDSVTNLSLKYHNLDEEELDISELADGKTYYWKIIAKAQGIPTIFESEIWHFSVQFGFTPIHRIEMYFNTASVSVKRGDSVIVGLTFQNLGNLAEVVFLDVLGELNGSVSKDERIELGVGEEKTLNVKIFAELKLELKTYNLTVRASFSGEECSTFIDVKVVDDPASITPDNRSKSWMLYIIAAFLFLVVIAILIFVVRRSKNKKEDEGGEVIEAEIEAQPSAGITKADLAMLSIPVSSPEVEPFHGRLSYKLPARKQAYRHRAPPSNGTLQRSRGVMLEKSVIPKSSPTVLLPQVQEKTAATVTPAVPALPVKSTVPGSPILTKPIPPPTVESGVPADPSGIPLPPCLLTEVFPSESKTDAPFPPEPTTPEAPLPSWGTEK